MVTVGILIVIASGPPAEAATASAPTEAGSSDWRMVSAGGGHTCGIRSTGRLYCWGWDAYGQLGDNPALTQQPTPAQVAGNHTDWTTVTAGSLHTCARRATGRLYCWGYDSDGQLGDNTGLIQRTTPTEVAGNHTDWTTVTATGNHTCARRATGRLYCWGLDSNGQLGDNAALTPRPTPAQVTGNRTDWATVTTGASHTCARRTTGRLYCWGLDGDGQLGDNPALTQQPTPTQVAGNHTDWATVTGGQAHTCARRTTGRLYCWGSDGFGKLGDNPTLGNQPTPTQVDGSHTDWVTVDAGSQATCARRATGRLYCWGYDGNGQLGDNPAIGDQPTPTQVEGGATDWTTVTAGGGHACARITSGRLYCWGYDGNGQLGDNPALTQQPTPVDVAA